MRENFSTLLFLYSLFQERENLRERERDKEGEENVRKQNDGRTEIEREKNFLSSVWYT